MAEYNEDWCKEKHETINKKLDKLDGDVVDLKVLNARMSTILERHDEELKPKVKPFWESDTGKRLMLFLMICGAGILTVAIGINLLDKIK